MTATGTLYVIAAPSGAGKTSLVRELLSTVPGVDVSVSHTTRPARPGERDGIDYYFVSLAEFEALKNRGIFLEYAQVFGHDHYYGTSRQTVMEQLQAGTDVILEIDWQGARQVKAAFDGERYCSVFILPPSRTALEQRLRDRGQDSEAVIAQRMASAVREMSHYEEFDYLIINDDFATALNALRSIFVANRYRRPAQIECQQELLRSLLS